MITAPYNFVPLNKEVFYPSWADDVSHDVPFEDGESGEIKIVITAKSPIFIRDHETPESFCSVVKLDGGREYYIPGSSMKGMVRNLVEIMSFSEIVIDEERWSEPMSVRDMSPKQYCLDKVSRMSECPQNRRKNLFSAPMAGVAQKCGLMTIKDDGTATLEDCGNVVVIHKGELANKYNIRVPRDTTASEKYRKVGHQMIDVSVSRRGRREIAVHGRGKRGKLVLTGDINGKKHEFVFIENGKSKGVEDKIVRNFIKVYFDNEEMEDGQYWRSRYRQNKKEKIPVFYLERNGKIIAVGLTQIFKLAYQKTLKEAASQNVKKGKIDLAKIIFGYVDGTNALKGRVQFSHLRSNTVTYEVEKKSEILGTPNPTYYPNYIEQTDINGNKVRQYKTLMDSDAVIRGYKQYPLQNGVHASQGGNDNEAVRTQFKPLESGTTFEGRIRFHNLKKEEIGALLSALTFHGQKQHYHTLGMAKPLGYGKIEITLTVDNLAFEQAEYLDAFEKMMDNWGDKEYTKWKESVQMQNLFAMHSENRSKALFYQLLENPKNKKKNDFAEAKKAREYLQGYISSNLKREKPEASGEEEKKASRNPAGKEDINALEEKFGDIKTQPKKRQEGGRNTKKPFRGTIRKVPKEDVLGDTSAPKAAPVPVTPPKEYTMKEIAQEVGMSVSDVVLYANASTLPMPKNLDSGSVLKEAQAKGLINRLKKETKQ